MRILYVAYPLLTVSPESAGGAEQVLWTLERAMAARGMVTSVAASAGSRVSGELVETGAPCLLPDDFERRNREHQDRIVEIVRRRKRQGIPFDLLHDMSGSFWQRASEIEAPVLSTLHLPRHFYSPRSLENVASNVSFNCVSESQARTFCNLAGLAGVVLNGIAVEAFLSDSGARGGVLWLGRICEEKAPHLAIEIAQRSGLPLTIAGQVYPFSYHRQYFEREINSRLHPPAVIFIERPSIEQKRRLLREAEALLITSQVEETSSLVAMEAAASGTPVVAFRRGALPEVVQEGVTGFLVDGMEQAVSSVEKIREIDASSCANYAARHFRSAAMAGRYLGLYKQITGKDGAQAPLSAHRPELDTAQRSSTPGHAKPACAEDPDGGGAQAAG